MAKVRDKTEEFKEVVRNITLQQGFDEAKKARVLASLIMRRPQSKSPFIQAACKTLESIQILQTFVVNHRKDYTDQHRTTDHDRDNIEHEIGVFVKACREQIETLKNSIENEYKKGQTMTWLGVHGDSTHADIIAHKHGVDGFINRKNCILLQPKEGSYMAAPHHTYLIVNDKSKVLILSERLHAVTTLFDQMRAARFREVIDRTMPRRMRQRQSKTISLETSVSNSVMDSEVMRQDVQTKPWGTQRELLDDETQALQVELTNLLDAVQETETKMVEMSALNHLFSTHVLQQAQQIERLYEQAIEATQNVEKGNEELAKAIERNSSSRTFLLLFLVVLTLTILFLDWYQ